MVHKAEKRKENFSSKLHPVAAVALSNQDGAGCFAEMKNLALNRKNPGAGPGRCVEVAASLAACFYRLFPVKVRSPSIRAGTVTYSQRGLPETLQDGRGGGQQKPRRPEACRR